MKRMICMLLVLVLCMYLPMGVLAATNSPGSAGRPSEIPKTGDTSNIQIWVPIMVISLIALVVLVVIYFKKMRK